MILKGASKTKLFLGNQKVKKVYKGDIKVYSSGNVVTYMVDSGVTYSEEVDEGVSVLNPTTFTPAKSGWTFVGWRTDGAANGTVISSLVMGDNPITLYAVFRQTVTITYYNGTNSTASSTSGNKYYNRGAITNPTFTISPAAMSGWSFRGWSTSSAATAGINYSSISGTAFSASTTLYSAYQRTLTLSYNGNSATSGSTAASTGTQYYNKGNYSNPAVSVRANGFARTNYVFNVWALNSTSGTQYAAGASITLTGNATMYALWVASTYNYGYTGGVQSFTAPCAGTYKLEVWGAQGGMGFNGNGTGGNGGYSYGNKTLSSNQILYVIVGGKGSNSASTNNRASGGYNGGGTSGQSASDCGGGAGGGATHIATVNRGVLSNYSSHKTEVLIVAGGGGGGFYHTNGKHTASGGTGGGTTGGTGAQGLYGQGAGGGQTSGAAFGLGESSTSNAAASGGGGYYGGYSGGQASTGGGGSGYIGGVLNSSMSNGQRSGNGYAKITLISTT